MGDAVLDPKNSFYGHTHPPLCVRGGEFSLETLAEQFERLIACGYIPAAPDGKRAKISLEVRPYPGCSEATSIQAMYEMAAAAFSAALTRKNG